MIKFMNTALSLALLGALACGMPACKARTFNPSRNKSFEPLHDASSPQLVPDSEVTDFSVKSLEKLGIKHKIVRVGTRAPVGDEVRGASDAASNPFAFFSTRVTFGAITSSQFNALKANFGGLTKVAYDPARTEWDLVDFLPPLIQALDAHRFVTHETRVTQGTWFDLVESANNSGLVRNFLDRRNGQKGFSISISANCHGTAYEVARTLLTVSSGFPTFTPIAWGSGSVGTQWVSMLDRASTPLSSPDSMGRQRVIFAKDLLPAANAAKRNAGRKLGDVIQFSSPAAGLMHSAVWLDDDLYFEKTDTASNMPYRLITYSDVLKVGGSFGLAHALANPEAGVAFLRFDATKLKAPDEILKLESDLLPSSVNFSEADIPPALAGEKVYLTNFEGMGTPPKPFPVFQRLKYLTLVPDADHPGRAALPPEAGNDAFFTRN